MDSKSEQNIINNLEQLSSCGSAPEPTDGLSNDLIQEVLEIYQNLNSYKPYNRDLNEIRDQMLNASHWKRPKIETIHKLMNGWIFTEYEFIELKLFKEIEDKLSEAPEIVQGSLSGNESDISDDVRPANDYYQYSYGYGSSTENVSSVELSPVGSDEDVR